MRCLSPLQPSRRRACVPAALCVLAVLSACTSAQNVLEPSALVANDAANPLPQAQFPMASVGDTQVAAIQTSAKVRFAPLVGATGDASTPLAARISTRASARGIGLVGAEDGSATHIMKGYFSAIAENGETTIIYVWDVLDPSGNRLHRFQGQARSPGQGWGSVTPQTMEAIADQTVDQLANWLVTRPG